MIKKILRFLGLCDYEPEVLPPYLGRPIDADTLKGMRNGAVAVVDRKQGLIRLALRGGSNGYYGFLMESGSFSVSPVLINRGIPGVIITGWFTTKAPSAAPKREPDLSAATANTR